MLKRVSIIALAMLLHFRSPAARSAEVSFNAQIRPILSDRCLSCHGPDEKNRKAKLRLDMAEGGIFREHDGKFPVKPGAPEQSQLYKRITSKDPEEKMPPPDSNLSLSESEIGLLRTWIEQGAKWEKHWAFIPPGKVQTPQLTNSSWPRNEIDLFILARLQQEGLKPAAEAPREKLIRRVSFDLTGLPPSVEQIDNFLADSSTNAYEKVVDRLLGSDAYGERMTVNWLDLARYSDTHGYQSDRYRAMWPWRDWVIKEFNQNMPYDQFVTWQLAGDLFPHPTAEQILATAFNRHHMQTEEGGSVEEEFRVSYVVDRVDTMGTAFLALTFECCRCHDHKFDPLAQRDFYSMFSFFNNIDESGQTSYFTDSMPVPTLLLAKEDQERKLAELKSSIHRNEKDFVALRQNARGAFEAWLSKKPKEPVQNGILASLSFEEIKDGKVQNFANAGKPAAAAENPQLVGGHHGKAAVLNGENGFVLNGIGEFSRVDPFSVSLWIRTPVLSKRAVVFHRSAAALDAGSRGYEMVLENGRVGLGLHHMWPGNALKIMSKSVLPTNEWVHLVMTYDGSSQARGLKLYWNGAETETETVRDHLWKDITYERGNPQLTIGFRFRDNGFRDGLVDEFKVFDRSLTPIEVEHLHGSPVLEETLNADNLSDSQRNALFAYYLANFNPLYAKHLADLHDLRAEQNKLVNSIPEVMAMQELPAPRPAFILKRGAYDAPGEPVTMDTPKAVLPFKVEYPRNRLGLAQWLFDPENPLPARVAANRVWQQMFGRGIVATSDNFGSQGDLPTHPELLDWLANNLRDHGWDMKFFLKQVAMSATYRQSSNARPETLAADPENKLLARMPAYRLTAEMLRDNALAASGLLVEKIGGPPVKPYQPDGLWEEKSGAHYERDKGEGLYRRSLYTFWKRTSPPPTLIAFDAAERNTCIVRRQVTSTPLQSLILLNDPQLTEASRWLAERMFKMGGGTLDSQITYLFRLLTSRTPRPSELRVLKTIYSEQRDLFAKNEQESIQLLTVGEKANDPAIAPIDLAAGSVVASALLNYDETIIKR